MAIKVAIDAGHYGKYNRSPVNATYYESDMAWKLHLKLKAVLEGYGIQVVTTRESQDKDLALTSRGKCAQGCNLFVSLHSNAAGSAAQTSTDRVEVIYPISGKCADLARQLAETISATMGTRKACGTYSRQGANGDYYGVIRGATSVGVPGLILEHSFHDYSSGGWCPASWLLVDSNLDKLARAEGKVIANYFGVSTTPKEDEIEMTMSKAELEALIDQRADAKLAKLTDITGTGDNPSPWAEEATRWAIEQGIFAGDGKGNFGWQQPVTREQVAMILMTMTKNV